MQVYARDNEKKRYQSSAIGRYHTSATHADRPSFQRTLPEAVPTHRYEKSDSVNQRYHNSATSGTKSPILSPTTKHTHKHNHLFIVIKGEARVEFENETIVIHKDEAYLVKGSFPHSVWNNSNGETVMIGISVK